MKLYNKMNEKDAFDFRQDVMELMPIAMVTMSGFQKWMRATMPNPEAKFEIEVEVRGVMEEELYNLLTKKWGFVEGLGS